MPDSQHESRSDSGPRLVREQDEGYYRAHVDDALSREGLSLSAGTEGPGSDDAFWLPAGVVVAWADERLGDDARSVLESFVELRRWYGYCVVEEMTDDAVGLTIRAWPLVDDRGRLRFDVSEDSLSVVVSKSVFLEVVAAERDRLFRVGLLDESLVERDVHYGDTFAVDQQA
ncbi:MAG: hypothetical protein GY788_13280, partial [bacterium]|nr:hypothetical protein [bacterium]